MITMKVAGFWQEFKTFAFKGDLIALAVAVVIGGAFGSVVQSLAKNLIMPVLSYLVPGGGNYRSWHLGKIEVGAFLSELINFLTVALALFLVIGKLIPFVQRLARPGIAEEPTTKECPWCLSVIPYKARKCAHCTSDLAESP